MNDNDWWFEKKTITNVRTCLNQQLLFFVRLESVCKKTHLIFFLLDAAQGVQTQASQKTKIVG